MSSRVLQENASLQMLVLAPTGRDAEVVVEALAAAGIDAEKCSTMSRLCRRVESGAGGALVAAETLVGKDRRALRHALDLQPEWSDFPVVVMETHDRERGPGWGFVRENQISYAVVLQRPVHRDTLVSTVRSALRSRARQYQVRDELAERRRVEAQLRESDRRKDEFMAMLGHELRNPLAAICNAAELIGTVESDDPVLGQTHGVLERQTAHMARLIDGLLEISRITRGKIQLERDTFDMRVVTRDVLHDRMSEAARRGLELLRELPDDPVWILADPVRLAQVTENLVGNALKFTREPGTVTVRLGQNGKHAVLEVLDTGAGIRPELLPHIFEPFQQEKQDAARSAGGLGLGLAVAKGLVELHHGTIEAQSEGPGTGARFVVRLPLATSPRRTRSREPSTETTVRRILMVEDNADAALVLHSLLQKGGHAVTVAATGAEALDRLRDQDFDLVVCDIGLPDISGYEIARHVRADAALHDIGLIALTGYGQADDRRKATEAGFDEHLTKPVGRKSLESAMAKVSELRPRAG